MYKYICLCNIIQASTWTPTQWQFESIYSDTNAVSQTQWQYESIYGRSDTNTMAL